MRWVAKTGEMQRMAKCFAMGKLDTQHQENQGGGDSWGKLLAFDLWSVQNVSFKYTSSNSHHPVVVTKEPSAGLYMVTWPVGPYKR